MGLFSFVLGLPFAPVAGVVRVAEILRDQVDQELYSTSSARAQLEATAEKRAAGQLTEEQEAATMHEVSQRMVRAGGTPQVLPQRSPDRQEE